MIKEPRPSFNTEPSATVAPSEWKPVVAVGSVLNASDAEVIKEHAIMKLSAKKIDRSKSFQLNMTSMIDCVFLLLIFFMVTMSFIRTERNLDSGIKVSRSSASSSSDFEPAVVRVVKSRSSDRFVFLVGDRELTSLAELERLMKQFDNKEHGAHVLVSDEAPYGMAAQALQACKSANFPFVSYNPIASSP